MKSKKSGREKKTGGSSLSEKPLVIMEETNRGSGSEPGDIEELEFGEGRGESGREVEAGSRGVNTLETW